MDFHCNYNKINISNRTTSINIATKKMIYLSFLFLLSYRSSQSQNQSIFIKCECWNILWWMKLCAVKSYSMQTHLLFTRRNAFSKWDVRCVCLVLLHQSYSFVSRFYASYICLCMAFPSKTIAVCVYCESQMLISESLTVIIQRCKIQVNEWAWGSCVTCICITIRHGKCHSQSLFASMTCLNFYS